MSYAAIEALVVLMNAAVVNSDWATALNYAIQIQGYSAGRGPDIRHGSEEIRHPATNGITEQIRLFRSMIAGSVGIRTQKTEYVNAGRGNA